MNAYAISDIHGCHRTFRALLDRLSLTTGDQLFLLGDFVNKGPDARGVLDTILELRQHGHEVHCIRGNHDEVLLDLQVNKRYRRAPQIFGAHHTLKSFGVDRAEDIPAPYLEFLEELDTWMSWENYLFVHAGFSFLPDSPFHDTYAHTHIRTWYHQLNYHWLGDRYIIHGHVQHTREQIEWNLTKLPELRVLGIDAGCVSVWEPGKGHLCALDLRQHACIFQGNLDYGS